MSILQDIARRLLNIRCPEIRLVRSGAPQLSIKGLGTVFVDRAGQIRFEFEVSPDQYKPFTKARLEHPRPVPESPKDEDYFELTAASISGTVLRGQLLYPEVNNTAPEGFWDGPGKAEGKVHQLTLEERSDPDLPSFAKFTIPRKLLIPRIARSHGIPDRKYCCFEFEQEKIEIFTEEDYTEIHCQVRQGGIATNRHWRMIEAIEFAFGQSIYPCGIEIRERSLVAITLVSTVCATENEAQLPPPLSTAGRVHHYPITELIRKFYAYISPYTEEHPPLMAKGLWSLRQAANAQPDPKALVFSTTAETLIHACFPNIKPVDANWKKEVGSLQERIKNDESLTPTLRIRASNKLTALTNEPNDEKIRTFIGLHVANKEEQDAIFKAWKDLRNPATHGKKIKPEEVEKAIKRINVVLDLCYSIVLYRIGFFHRRVEYANPCFNSWSPLPVSHSRSDRAPLGSMIDVRNFSWNQNKSSFRKVIALTNVPRESIVLAVRSDANDSPPFSIDFSPIAILPDQIAEYQIRTGYPTLSEAQLACDEIAKRVLVHITLQHFAS